jgi:hypothetical protein
MTDAQTAAYALRCIHGYGVATSEAAVAAMDTEIVKEIARYEREGRRHNIPVLLQPTEHAGVQPLGAQSDPTEPKQTKPRK